jgi:thymidylate synthase (FAD)
MKADYIDHMGDDLRVVNAARVSFDKESVYQTGTNQLGRDENILEMKDEKLIAYLAKHNHWTPFSHPMVTMRETVPIFVARQRFKHMVGFTYNEVSRRYVDDEPEFFEPVWRWRADNKKQGSAENVEDYQLIQYVDELFWTAVGACEEAYRKLLDAGIAPEQARMVLPQSMYTSYYVTGSLAAWARAYKLRIDPHAQKEIQDLAVQWDTIIRPLFPVSWSALVDV